MLKRDGLRGLWYVCEVEPGCLRGRLEVFQVGRSSSFREGQSWRVFTKSRRWEDGRWVGIYFHDMKKMGMRRVVVVMAEVEVEVEVEVEGKALGVFWNMRRG